MMHCFRTSRTSGSNQKIRRRAMATQSAAIFVVFMSLYQTDPVIGCSVTPSAAAVLAGSSVSVTCIPTSEESVAQWMRQNENRTVYQAPILKTNRFVAEGYSVNDTNLNEVILTVKSGSVQYADNYVCICLIPPSTASKGNAFINVIETEPLFNATNSLSINDPVLFTCSLEFAGNANLLMQITNSTGKVLAELNENIATNGSQQFNLYNSTSSAIETKYFCKIALRDASDPKTIIFNRTLTRTVQFSVRSVSISPESPERCRSDGFCETNSVLLCKAEGNPEPKRYSFTIIHQNGTKEESPTDKYTVKYVGQQVIQCTAFNEINGNMYNQSISFTTNGTEESLVPAGSVDNSKAALIGGLVGGLGGGLLIIIIIAVILIWYKRQRSKQSGEARTEDAIETKDFTKGNKGNGQQTTNGQTNIAEISGDERVLIDNTLYSGSKGGAVYNAAIDPSDGGYAAINELGTVRKG